MPLERKSSYAEGRCRVLPDRLSPRGKSKSMAQLAQERITSHDEKYFANICCKLGIEIAIEVPASAMNESNTSSDRSSATSSSSSSTSASSSSNNSSIGYTNSQLGSGAQKPQQPARPTQSSSSSNQAQPRKDSPVTAADDSEKPLRQCLSLDPDGWAVIIHGDEDSHTSNNGGRRSVGGTSTPGGGLTPRSNNNSFTNGSPMTNNSTSSFKNLPIPRSPSARNAPPSPNSGSNPVVPLLVPFSFPPKAQVRQTPVTPTTPNSNNGQAFNPSGGGQETPRYAFPGVTPRGSIVHSSSFNVPSAIVSPAKTSDSFHPAVGAGGKFLRSTSGSGFPTGQPTTRPPLGRSPSLFNGHPGVSPRPGYSAGLAAPRNSAPCVMSMGNLM